MNKETKRISPFVVGLLSSGLSVTAGVVIMGTALTPEENANAFEFHNLRGMIQPFWNDFETKSTFTNPNQMIKQWGDNSLRKSTIDVWRGTAISTSQFTCHSNCHSSCHGNCGRKGW